MIYLYAYLTLSTIITLWCAQWMINKFGDLEYVVEHLRMMDDDGEKYKDLSNREIVTVCFIAGFVASPLILAYTLMERMSR